MGRLTPRLVRKNILSILLLKFGFPKDNCVMKKAKYVFEGIAVVALVAVSTNSFVFAQEKNL